MLRSAVSASRAESSPRPTLRNVMLRCEWQICVVKGSASGSASTGGITAAKSASASRLRPVAPNTAARTHSACVMSQWSFAASADRRAATRISSACL